MVLLTDWTLEGVAPAARHRLTLVCSAVVTALTADGAAVSLQTAVGPRLIWATDDAATSVEQAQQLLGEGPAGEAFATQLPVVVPDLRGVEAGTRWPALADAVAEVPVGRYVALPMAIGGIRLGVLSVYDEAPGPLPAELLPVALAAADSAALASLDSAHAANGGPPLADLGPDPHYEVHQATGMVMAQTGMNALDALARLRARAYQEDVSLAALASRVVSRSTRFAKEVQGP